MVPLETAAVSARPVHTIQQCIVSRHFRQSHKRTMMLSVTYLPRPRFYCLAGTGCFLRYTRLTPSCLLREDQDTSKVQILVSDFVSRFGLAARL